MLMIWSSAVPSWSLAAPSSHMDATTTSSYTSAHENYLCVRRLGNATLGDTYPLPCKKPREDWKPQPLTGTFPIAAWWPPNADVLDAYAAANFNLLLGDNLPSSCQAAGTMPSPATAMDAFECTANLMPHIDKLGLKLSWFTGHYNMTHGFASVQGGDAAYGGVIEQAPSEKTNAFFISAPEVAWVVSELRRRNLSDVLYSIFLRDDVVTSPQSVVESVRWLRENAPRVLPQVNGGKEDLYQDRQPIWSPEEYAVQGASTSNVTTELWRQMAMFSHNQYFAERYGLDVWPLFNLLRDERGSDGQRMPFSDSLLRAQVNMALAYGAKGLYYYCWGDNGLWNLTMPDAFSGPGAPMPNYFVARALNADAMLWGTTLLSARQVGALRAPSVQLPPCQYDGKSNPATACRGWEQMPRAAGQRMPIQHLDDNLVAGLFVADGATRDGDVIGYAMVVDVRVDATPGALGVVNSSLTFHPSCAPTVLPGAPRAATGDGDDADTSHPLVASDVGATVVGMAVTVRLEAGGGQLVALRGGAACVEVLRAVRRRFFPSRNPTAWAFRPMWYDGLGAGGRRFLPGGLAGSESQILIGGSYAGAGGGWRSPREAAAWSQAGFSMASISIGENQSTLRRALGLAAAFGSFVVAAPDANSSAAAADVRGLVGRYGCHPNLIGMRLANAAAGGAAGVVAAADAMRQDAFWMLPLVTGVTNAADAVDLANEAAVPTAAVALPRPPPPTTAPAAHVVHAVPTRDDAAMAWGQKAINSLATLAYVASNASIAMSMTVSVDTCATEAESLLRFGASAAILLGTQLLWWEGVGECAPIGSEAFGLIGEINRRLATWAQPLMLPAGPALPPHYRVDAVWTTSTIVFPPIGGVGGTGAGVVPRPPGTTHSDLVQLMDDELIAIELTNRSNVPRGAATRVLLVLSTELSTTRGAPPVRQLELTMRADVSHTVPVEPDAVQGFADLPWGRPLGNVPNAPPDFMGADRCPMGWLGPRVPLRLAGGAVQVMRVQTLSEAPTAEVAEPGPRLVAGRRAPRLVME